MEKFLNGIRREIRWTKESNPIWKKLSRRKEVNTRKKYRANGRRGINNTGGDTNNVTALKNESTLFTMYCLARDKCMLLVVAMMFF